MKRLLDEPGDEVTRLLIEAGVEHQPPRDGKVRLMTALGVGSALGLASSEVWAWFGTGTGKVVATVAFVGAAAGGAYVATADERPRATLAQGTPTAHVAEPPHVASDPPPVPEAPADVAQVEAEPPSAEAAPERDRGVARRTAKRKLTRPSEPRDERRLGEETAAVDRLKRLAERGESDAVSALLESYYARFPEGQLRPEVERLQRELQTARAR